MAQSNPITLQCHCGTKLRVAASAVGKKVKCPKCGEVLVIRAPGSTPASGGQPGSQRHGSGVERAAPASPQRPVHSSPKSATRAKASIVSLAQEDDSGYSIADDSDSSPLPPLPAASSCPECAAVMSAESVLCVACGYDRRSGRFLKTKRRSASALSGAASAVGKFVLGTILSCAGAFLGVVVWCAGVIFTGYEIGWIAWGLGGLAGLGMVLGYRDQNMTAGGTAAGIAVLGILAAKGVIYLLVSAAVREAGQPPIGFAELFGGLDVLFFGLALVTAFRIASGRFSSD